MKLKLILALGTWVVLSACSKDEDRYAIGAGQIGPGIDAFWHVKEGKINMDRSGTDDLSVGGFSMSSPAGYVSRSTLYVNADDFQVLLNDSGRVPKKLGYGDLVSSEGAWTSGKGSFNIAISYRDPSTKIVESEWLNSEAYVGVRFEYETGSYKYGWLRISLGNGYSSAELLNGAIRK